MPRFFKPYFSKLNALNPIDLNTHNMRWISGLMCLYSVNELFAGTFLLAYLFKLSGESLLPVAYYYLSFYGSSLVLSYITGYGLKNRKIVFYRLGCLFEFVFLLVLWGLKERAGGFTVLLGIIYGLACAFHYYPYNLLISGTVSQKAMIKYQGYMDGLKSVIKICVPFLLGLFLSFDSFASLTVFLSGLTVLNFAGSFFVREKAPRHRLPYRIGAYLKKTFRKKELWCIYFMEYFKGLALEGVLSVVITLYIAYLFKTDFNLGSLTSLFSFATLAVNFLFGKYAKYQDFVKILIITTVLTTGASLLFVLYPGKGTFILYNLCFVTATRLLLIITGVNMFNGANVREVRRLFKTEYFAVREIILNCGRLTGTAGLLTVAFFHNFELLRYFLLALTVCGGVMGFCTVLINRALFPKNRF